MDAKPQRPFRATRAFGDENAVPATTAQKTIHQRNKSSPALSSLLGGGVLKVAAKRTAFGDLSNTVNAARPSKDDSVITLKTDGINMEKAMLAQDQKKSAALLRPAQRPLSVAGLKGLLSSVTHSNNLPSLTEPTAEQPHPVQANSRKVLTKRNTTIYKDNAPAPPEKANSELSKPLPSTSSTAPVHHDLMPVQQLQEVKQVEIVQESTLKDGGAPYAVKVEAVSRMVTTESYGGPTFSEEVTADSSDGIYLDNNGNVQLYQYADTSDVTEPLKIISEPGLTTVKDHQSTNLPTNGRELQAIHETQVLSECRQGYAAVQEPEEYWDEEDDENYDEEGYVTARSLKSRGDNTTGGVTTIFFPKMNQKIRRELAAAKTLVENSRTAEEIEDESWDTSMVAEYGDEIFQYMRELEIKMLPNAHYMDNQTEIQWSMRSVLMDWLVQVHHRFGLLPETLFLCVNYIDRFLSCKIVSLGKLQLVGATAIFVAAKYEEINCPSVQEIVYMVDNGYSVDEILKAERYMLSMLQFELGWPGPMSFLRRISKADDYDLETRTLAKYFLEVTIMDERFVGTPPSFAAAGAHCLARMMLKKGNWSPAHVYYSNYTYSQLFSLILLMVECCETPTKHHSAIFDKYSDKRYKRASNFVEAEMKKGFQISDITSTCSSMMANPYEDRHNWNLK